ncbi:MAG: NTP transferase domain-containing protein, partial [Acidobacteriota bacterium]|nr:NTP transferase domain-containing protein [Acidobacteriota bacterium]
GLRALDLKGIDRVLFTLVDHPAVAAETVAKLMETGADIVIPRLEGKRGHPVLMRAALAAEYLDEPKTAKVRDTIDRHANRILYVDVSDPGVRDDVDDPAVYEALLAREAARV